ncbi:hypothetical protein PO124_20070 [Bacillus licheniformis]|nr:hypothetical protein [Bacillus licheniformis]
MKQKRTHRLRSKPDQAIKSRTAKRRLSWMTPILSGIIGGSLVLGVTTYQHSKDETANTSVQTQTNETSNSSASSTKANTENCPAPIRPTFLQWLKCISRHRRYFKLSKQTESGMFGFESNSSSSSEQETGTGSGVIYKKQTAKHTLLQITTLSKARLN